MGGIGCGELTERIVIPVPSGGSACEGAACGGDGFALADGIHGVSVAGYDAGTSLVFDGAQGVTGAFVGAVGGEGGVSADGVAGDGVGHEVPFEILAGGGTDAEVTGVGLGIGVAIGESPARVA